MELKIIKALWGMTGSLEQQFENISNAGYNGIEAPLPAESHKENFKTLLSKYNFDYIAMIFTGGSHLESFSSQLKAAVEFNPIMVNSHSSSDSFAFEQQLEFFGNAVMLEKEVGIPVAHETHRGRAMFTPWNTAALLKKVDGLKLTADFSHWCCVCESLLQDQKENLETAINRALHIHGRVGYEEGPQVPHPGAPEYSEALAAHLDWWLAICRSRQSAGAKYITFTPEFGPPKYLHTLPYTNAPVADLWEVCKWMADYFKGKFTEAFT